MNQAHLHLVFNHFPIIGLFFGISILLYGTFKKQQAVINIAYFIFAFAMLMGKATMMTGEGAEHIVEELGVSHDLIHEHEENAELFMKFIYILGILSLIQLLFSSKIEKMTNWINYLIIFVCVISIYFSVKVGVSGGEIQHKEIRTENIIEHE